MEESAKRRERLIAMRAEASQAAVDNNAEHDSVSHGLSNPLIESSSALPGQVESIAPQRFDYYTDPMSAFSGNKRGSKASHQISLDYSTPPRPQNTEMTPPPARQAQNNFSSDQRIYQAPVYHNSSPYRDATGIPGPFGTQPRTPPSVWSSSDGTSSNYFPSNSPRGANFPSPSFGQGGSPNFNPGQGRGPWFSNSLGPGSGCGGNSGQGRGHWFSNSPGPGSGRGSSPSFGPGGSPGFNSGPGRGNWFSNSLGPGSGSGGGSGLFSGGGRGRWASPGTGPSGGRGRGSYNNATAELRPDLYFSKSMVDDPWKLLKPVVWRRENIPSLRTLDSVKSWISKPVSSKKAKVAETSSTQASSQPSLAEYLAASFNEAVKDETAM